MTKAAAAAAGGGGGNGNGGNVGCSRQPPPSTIAHTSSRLLSNYLLTYLDPPSMFSINSSGPQPHNRSVFYPTFSQQLSTHNSHEPPPPFTTRSASVAVPFLCRFMFVPRPQRVQLCLFKKSGDKCKYYSNHGAVVVVKLCNNSPISSHFLPPLPFLNRSPKLK